MNRNKARAIVREWYRKNKDRRKIYMREWFRKNKDKMRIWHQEWRNKNRKRMAEWYNRYDKERKKIDIKYHLDKNIRIRVWQALKAKKAGQGWKNLVGYEVEDLISHLEKQFDDKMTWENYGSYWQIDHIKPISLFKYKTAEDTEFKKCWALENLQPLEAKENLRKGNRI